jgi:sec-independent protein translocase protein TatA
MWTPGPLEIIIILVIVLIVFGPKRLPDLGKSLGRGMREFKDSVTGKDSDDDEPRRLAQTEPAPPAEPAAPAEPTATHAERPSSD